MTNFDEKEKTIDIPDFVEDKDADDSTSVDMSIFKMSEDELYDEPKSSDDKKEKKTGKKKSNSTLILCLILICILLAVSAGALVFAFKQRSEISNLKSQVTQLNSQVTELTTKNNTLENEKKTLEDKIKEIENAGTAADPNNPYPKGTVLYITEDGSTQGVRVKADSSSDTAVNSDGMNIVLYWGDEVTLLENATVDANGTYWGKIDTGFIRIKVGEEVWATTDPQ